MDKISEVVVKARVSLLSQAIVGAAIGAGLAGLAESIEQTITWDYGRWTLPVTALGFYAFLGSIAGVGLWCVLSLLLFFAKGDIGRRKVFAVCAASMFTFFGLSCFFGALSALVGLSSDSSRSFLSIGMLVSAVF